MPSFYPPFSIDALALGAMSITAGVVAYPDMVAGITLVYMSTHIDSSAILNCMKCPEVMFGLWVGLDECCEVISDNVSQLKSWFIQEVSCKGYPKDCELSVFLFEQHEGK